MFNFFKSYGRNQTLNRANSKKKLHTTGKNIIAKIDLNGANVKNNNTQIINIKHKLLTLVGRNNEKITSLFGSMVERYTLIINNDNTNRIINKKFKQKFKSDYYDIIMMVQKYISNVSNNTEQPLFNDIITTIEIFLIKIEIISLQLEIITLSTFDVDKRITYNKMNLQYIHALSHYQSNINNINNIHDILKLQNIITNIIDPIKRINNQIKYLNETFKSLFYYILKEITIYFINKTQQLISTNIIEQNTDKLEYVIKHMMIISKKTQPEIYNILIELRNFITIQKEQYTITNNIYDMINEQLKQGVPMTDAVQYTYMYMRDQQIPEELLIPIFTPFFVTSSVANTIYQPIKYISNMFYPQSQNN